MQEHRIIFDHRGFYLKYDNILMFEPYNQNVHIDSAWMTVNFIKLINKHKVERSIRSALFWDITWLHDIRCIFSCRVLIMILFNMIAWPLSCDAAVILVKIIIVRHCHRGSVLKIQSWFFFFKDESESNRFNFLKGGSEFLIHSNISKWINIMKVLRYHGNWLKLSHETSHILLIISVITYFYGFLVRKESKHSLNISFAVHSSNPWTDFWLNHKNISQ